MNKSIGNSRDEIKRSMKRLFVFIVLFFVVGGVMGQSYYNEWIDYNKVYYKFKVGSTGLYRISANDLTAAGTR